MVHIAAHQGNLECLKVFAGVENAVEIFKVQDKVSLKLSPQYHNYDVSAWAFQKVSPLSLTNNDYDSVMNPTTT